jgi:hypothetical protein
MFNALHHQVLKFCVFYISYFALGKSGENLNTLNIHKDYKTLDSNRTTVSNRIKNCSRYTESSSARAIFCRKSLPLTCLFNSLHLS